MPALVVPQPDRVGARKPQPPGRFLLGTALVAESADGALERWPGGSVAVGHQHRRPLQQKIERIRRLRSGGSTAGSPSYLSSLAAPPPPPPLPPPPPPSHPPLPPH